MRNVLIVANQTLGGPELVEEIEKRAAQEPCSFWVLVPATQLADLSVAPSIGILGGPLPVPAPAHGADGTAAAESKLAQELERLRGLGLTAAGEIGDPDPIEAIRTTVEARQFDEIILATLPQGISRWLRQDLVHRVQRRFPMPVTHVVSTR
jgi:hypothetical protein